MLKNLRLYCLLAVVVLSSSAAEVPAGWLVASASIDARLVSLSDEELIGRLREERDFGQDARLATELGTFLPLEKQALAWNKEEDRRKKSPTLVEVIRRGDQIVPMLLSHLNDVRPTGLVLDAKKFQLNGPRWDFTAVYDYRNYNDNSLPLWSKTRRNPTEHNSGSYTVLVGDLCYVALGRIVNRRLYVSGPDFGNGMMYLGIFFMEVNSPVHTPALAEATRADWGNLSKEGFAAALKEEAITRDSPDARNKPGQPWKPPVDRIGALIRLLYYFPLEGSNVAEALLARPVQSMTGEIDKSGATVFEIEQTKLVRALAAFHGNGLDAAVWDLFRSAAAEEERFVASTPVKDHSAMVFRELSLACAEHLLHRGHDNELRAYFLAQTRLVCQNFDAIVAAFQKKVAASMAASVSKGQAIKLPPEVERQQLQGIRDSLRISLLAPLQRRITLLRNLGVPESELPPML